MTYDQVFQQFIEKYKSEFHNPPSTAQQLMNYCKQHSIPFKYAQVSKLFNNWSLISNKMQKVHQKKQKKHSKVVITNDESMIDWDLLWIEYQTKHSYAPKKPLHLFKFAKKRNSTKNIKFVEARNAFQRLSSKINDEQNKNAEGIDIDIDGRESTHCKRFLIQMTVDENTSDIPFENENEIKNQFLGILNEYRKEFKYDPKNGRKLWKYLQNTGYEAKYAHVNLCFDIALKYQWFIPLKLPSNNNNLANAEGIDIHGYGDAQQSTVDDEIHGCSAFANAENFVKKQEMSDIEYNAILEKYSTVHKNAPLNAAQIMNFTKMHLNIGYRYSTVNKAMIRHKMQMNCN